MKDFYCIRKKIEKAGKKRIIIVFFVCVLIIIGSIGLKLAGSSATADTTYLTAEVIRDDISTGINSSGTLEASKRAEIKVASDATVETVAVSEGDRVEKDDILMELSSDTQDTDLEIQRLNFQVAHNELLELKDTLSSLKVYAPVSGHVVLSFNSIGDTLNSGSTFAEITNGNEMEIKAPFNPSVVNSISVGDTAQVLITGYYQSISGIVTAVGSTAKPYSEAKGALYYEVTVEIENPGALTEYDIATATVENSKGNFTAIDTAPLSYKKGSVLRFDTSAQLDNIYISDGDYVNKGDLIAEFSSESLETQIQNQEIAVTQKQLQYTQELEKSILQSPISGTVLSANFQEGDSVESNDTAFVISDIDTLQVVVPVDEYDIQNIYEGQTAVVTTQAYPNTEFKAEVIKVGLEGTASSGVSTFDVTLSLITSEGLKPGMNVNTDIIIGSSKDTLILPVEAVSQMRGQYVAIKQDSGEPVQLKVGLISDTYVEILDGLSEGDIVKYAAELGTGENDRRGGMMMMPGGPQGGGNRNSGGPR